MNANKEGGYLRLALVTLVVILSWGAVPAFAEMAKMPGVVTTALVNAFAVIGIIVLLFVTRKVKTLSLLPSYWKQFVWLGFWWPLVYSLVFFQAIYISSGALVAVANYLWPLAAIYLYYRGGYKVSPTKLVVVALSCLVVGGILFYRNSTVDGWLPIALGLIAGALQGYFNYKTGPQNDVEFPKDLVLLLTLVGAVVTMLGGAALSLLTAGWFLPTITWDSFWPVLFIGLVSNGIGFSAFLYANKLADTDKKNTLFLCLMALVPFAQVVGTFLRSGKIDVIYLIGAILVALIVAGYGLWENPKMLKLKDEKRS